MRPLISFAATLIFAASTTAAAQQSPLPGPPKPVHPTPVPATGCRGCSDAGGANVARVQGYDDKSADSTRRPKSVAAPVRKKAKPPAARSKRRHRKPKTRPKPVAAKSVAIKPRPRFENKPPVLDPVIPPRASVSAKAKADTVKK